MSDRVAERQLLGLLIISSLAIGLGWFFVGPTLIVVGPVLSVLTFSECRRRSQLAARRASAAAMPTIVDQLIHQLRAGHSLGRSCLQLEEPIGLVRPLTESLGRRQTLSESAGALAFSDDRSVRLLAVTLGVLADNGGPAVPALQRLRHTLIGVINGQRRADAEASQALASAGLMVLAPSAFAILVALLDAEAARFYLREPIGAGCVLVSLLLSWMGWCWIQRQLALAQRGGL
ncbi:MAG: type II secretion system F family protein [Acidimicrobiales bacterium]